MTTYNLLDLNSAEIGIFIYLLHKELHGENRAYIADPFETTPAEMLEKIRQITGLGVLRLAQA